MGSEPSVEKKRGRVGWLNTLQVVSIGFNKYCSQTFHQLTRERNNDSHKLSNPVVQFYMTKSMRHNENTSGKINICTRR